jgi:DNA-directed RNA polymerase subunit K/omega
MNAQRRHRNSSKYVNTSLREIQEEDISREDDRDDLRNARRGRAPKLPNIFDP